MKDLLLTVLAAIQQILIQEGMTDPINNRIVQDMTAKEAIIRADTKDRSRVDTTVLKAGIKDLNKVVITDLRADLILQQPTDARWVEDVLKDLQNSFWLTRSNWHRLKNFTKRCCRFLTPMHMRLLENK